MRSAKASSSSPHPVSPDAQNLSETHCTFDDAPDLVWRLIPQSLGSCPQLPRRADRARTTTSWFAGTTAVQREARARPLMSLAAGMVPGMVPGRTSSASEGVQIGLPHDSQLSRRRAPMQKSRMRTRTSYASCESISAGDPLGCAFQQLHLYGLRNFDPLTSSARSPYTPARRFSIS